MHQIVCRRTNVSKVAVSQGKGLVQHARPHICTALTPPSTRLVRPRAFLLLRNGGLQHRQKFLVRFAYLSLLSSASDNSAFGLFQAYQAITKEHARARDKPSVSEKKRSRERERERERERRRRKKSREEKYWSAFSADLPELP